MAAQVRPVVRPLLATPRLTAVLSSGAVVLAGLPISKMAPEVSTSLATICARAASTLAVLSGMACENFATVCVALALQPTSTRPGWLIASPTLADADTATVVVAEDILNTVLGHQRAERAGATECLAGVVDVAAGST